MFCGPGHRPEAGCTGGSLLPLPRDLRLGARHKSVGSIQCGADTGLLSQVEVPSTFCVAAVGLLPSGLYRPCAWAGASGCI